MSESRILTEQLRDKALLALEDAVQECRYRRPRRSFAVSFALAYLWAYGGGGDRRPYDELWQCLASERTPWSFSCANTAVLGIYVALGLDRPDEVESRMWQRWTRQEGHGGHH